MAWGACLDACVLMPGGLRDDVLSVASTRVYRPVWSSGIIAELERNLPDNPWLMTPDQIAHLLTEMRESFPAAEVPHADWAPRERWVPDEVHPGDRHVVAATVASDARLIVTANLKHFVPAILRERLGIEVKHPDDFLEEQFELAPYVVAEGVRRQIERLGRTSEQHVAAVAARLPRYGSVLEAHIELLDD